MDQPFFFFFIGVIEKKTKYILIQNERNSAQW